MARNVSFSCEICQANTWDIVYSGKIRDGAYGNFIDSEILHCKTCGVERQIESTCLKESGYIDGNYRADLNQTHDLDDHYKAHEALAKFSLDAIRPYSMRGKTVADIGCGGGILLDYLAGQCKNIIAIEPDEGWRHSLNDRGYERYSTIKEAVDDWGGKVDFVFSTQVIEHILNPRDFLNEIANLLSTDGILILTTPNRDDILMKLMPDTFPQFFYRRQHRWCFTINSLLNLVGYTGFEVMSINSVHRYGISNMMNWLKEKQPCGNNSIDGLNKQLDNLWQMWLESHGMGENLCLVAKKSLSYDK